MTEGGVGEGVPLPRLFEPLMLRDLRLRNRIVVSPMLTYSAVDNAPGDWHLTHLGRFAAGGAGLVFVEATAVSPEGALTYRDLGLWSDRQVAPFKRLVDHIHALGGAAALQLNHGGRKARTTLPWEGRTQIGDAAACIPGGEAPWRLLSSSAVPHGPGFQTPEALSLGEIEAVIDTWGEAARRADAAGFDVLEVHGAHGYLIHQFLSPDANRRTDGFGGDLEGRMRFACAVVERVRAAWPAHKPLFFRTSAVDGVGWEIDHSIALAEALQARGVDVIDCSSGGMTVALGFDRPLIYGYQVAYAREIARRARAVTMAVGLIIHHDQAEAILGDGVALVALGREFLHNPNWPMDAVQKFGFPPSACGIEPTFGYWLDKRAHSGFDGVPSTWKPGIAP